MKTNFRYGLVTSIDTALCRARVIFQDMDFMSSYWLPVLQQKTLKDKVYWMPDVYEQVVCLVDEYAEEGVILGAIYSDEDAPPVQDNDLMHIRFSDGTVVQYDREAHKLYIDVKGEVEIKAEGDVKVITTGDVKIEVGDIVSIKGDLEVEGSINATGTVIDSGGNTNHHGH